MPFMYCSNETDLAQADIVMNNETLYQCVNHTIQVTHLINDTADNSRNKTLECDVEEDGQDVYCKNGTLFSSTDIFCNSTTFYNITKEIDAASLVNETDFNSSDYDSVPETMTVANDNSNSTKMINLTIPIIYCYQGQLPKHKVAYIPTTTEEPLEMFYEPTETTERNYSFAAKVHLFLLSLIGKETETLDILNSPTEAPTTTTPKDSWVPEALTIPPTTTTTTQRTTTTPEPPFEWMDRFLTFEDDGNVTETLFPVPKFLLETQEMINKMLSRHQNHQTITYPPTWIKVYITTTPSSEVNETTTEEPIHL